MGEWAWEWVDDNGKWHPYHSVTSQLIEASYSNNDPFTILQLFGNGIPSHSVEFGRKGPTQYNPRTCGHREVRRNASGIWEYWEGQWTRYQPDLQVKIEDAWRQSGSGCPQGPSTGSEPASMRFTIKGNVYSLSFETDGSQINLETKKRRHIRRRCLGFSANAPARPLPDARQSTVSYDPSSLVQVDGSQAADDVCAICLEELWMEKPEAPVVKLSKCSHMFHRECIITSMAHTPRCPICKSVYGIVTGSQPMNGGMTVERKPCSVDGYPDCGTIVISYTFPNGIQGPEHPAPGQPYSGTSRVAYLPDNAEGQEVLALLRTAFARRLIFSVGRSATTGADNRLVWTIHHKTSMSGGPSCHGYPDEGYLARVREELKDQGVE